MEIKKYDAESILEDETFIKIFEMEDTIEREQYIQKLTIQAKVLGVFTKFNQQLAKHRAQFEKYKTFLYENISTLEDFGFIYTQKGKLKNVIQNYLIILRNDKKFKGKLFLNELSDLPEKKTETGQKIWTDVDDSESRRYIEEKYNIYHEAKLEDALKIVFQENSYNPVKERIESIKWDGKSRITKILSKWLGVVDDAYTREVSRLIFAGGIHRLYEPGCKFDEMPVLVGTKQGEGKSSFVRWLALEDDYFREVKEIDGQKGIEVLQGAWICEMSELLALTKVKEVESVKAYISCQVDTYRKPYEKRISKIPRHCIFIGTTNKATFLTDKTGNRRFYPVTVECTGYELHQHKQEIMEDIKQCWAEALALYKEGKLSPYARQELVEEIRKHQEEALEDDYRVGLIKKYLENKTEVCVLEIWRRALMNGSSVPSRKESCDISLILSKLPDWKKGTGLKRFLAYGPQRFWRRIIQEEKEVEEETLPF